MSTYVLIHGAYHGGWCWDKVVPLLEAAGHKVVAPDLPGHGKDKTPISEITLDAYANRACEVIQQQSEPVILVGHSMGGRVITQAAEYCPDGIETLVYLTASLLKNGEWESPGPAGMGSKIAITSEDKTYRTADPNGVKQCFYGDCSDEDIERAKSLVCPQAIAPTVTPMRTTDGNFGRIPRVYIECLQDNAVLPEAQKLMYTDLPCKRVITMDTSHSPFFSAPQELTDNLISVSKG